jgi:hypothetical protein
MVGTSVSDPPLFPAISGAKLSLFVLLAPNELLENALGMLSTTPAARILSVVDITHASHGAELNIPACGASYRKATEQAGKQFLSGTTGSIGYPSFHPCSYLDRAEAWASGGEVEVELLNENSFNKCCRDARPKTS